MSGSGSKLKKEDRVLWGKVARTTRPLHGKMEDLIQLDEMVDLDGAQSTAEVAPSSAKPGREDTSTSGQKKPETHRHHPLERPVKRKLSKGHLALEARIDLHGLVQSEAHGMLLDFLIRAHERGLRHVLVITGKGSSFGSEGALKRAVPLWFSLPEFRFLISSYEPAGRKHGGEGALYVRLARHGQVSR